VRRGDGVHIALRNCPAFIAVWLATARLGAWIVPVDPASPGRDITMQIARVDPRVGLCARTRANIYRGAVADSALPLIELEESADDIRPGGPLSATPRESARQAIAPSDRHAVMFTSGTTSMPKGVVLSQRNYVHVGAEMAQAAGLQSGHRWLVTLPLFHANAQYYCFAPAITVGASVALTGTFSASRWLKQAQQLGATHASLFAAPIRMILSQHGEPPSLKLEHVWFAQALGVNHYEEFARLVGVRPRQLYGMTETVAIVSYDRSDPASNDVIGTPLAGRRVELRSPDTDTPVPIGQPGVIWVHGKPGDDLFVEYLDAPEITSNVCHADAEGVWFRTGDLAVKGGDGVLRFVGRVDDVIKVSGENVSLTEVEAALAQAPGLLEAAVVARPDPVRDQVPVAYVVARDPDAPPSVESLKTWAAGNLAPQARPRDYTFVSELPRTSVGKIRRFALSDAPQSRSQ
jgi:carnitine-CoA ligase